MRDGNKRTGRLKFLRCLPNPPTPDVVCLQELHYVSEAEVRDWFRSRAFQFWLRLVLLVLAAVPSFINLSSPWWPVFVTLVAASCTVLSHLLM